MKKIFLSFAALALVAVGTVSCGGDDSSPVKPTTDNPGNTDTPNPGTDTPGTTTYGTVVYGGETLKTEKSLVEIDGYEGVDDAGEVFQAPSIYTLQGREGHYVMYYTETWSGNYDGGLAEMPVYTYHGYYVQIPVELNDQGQIVNYTLVLPHEADELLIAGAGLAIDGTAVSGATAAGIDFNTFDVTAGAGTTSFNGQINFPTGNAVIAYNGPTTFSLYIAPQEKGGQSLKSKMKLNNQFVATPVALNKIIKK